MAAAQFGGHPRLSQYIQWLVECDGHAKSGFRRLESGKTIEMTKLVTAEGRIAIVTGTKQNDRLEPTLVARLDRQLQVRSPWHPPE